MEDLIGAGGKILLNISASPFYLRKRELRQDMLSAIAKHYRVPVAMVNQVGGNDSLVFDGSSLALGPDGEVIAQAKSFEEDMVCFDTETLTGDIHDRDEGVEASAYAALGPRHARLRAQVRLPQGGAGAQRRHRLGADRRHRRRRAGQGKRDRRRHAGPYSSQGSIDDAAALAKNLGIRFEVIRDRRHLRLLPGVAEAGLRQSSCRT